MFRALMLTGILLAPLFSPAAQTGTMSGLMSLAGCSGVIVRQGESAALPAIAITAGHCIRETLLGVGEDFRKAAFARSGLRIFGEDRIVYIEGGVTVAFATMTDRDLAILRLPVTQGELEKSGVRLHELRTDKDSTTRGQTVAVKSGFWLQQRACAIDAQVRIQEGGFHFADVSSLSPGCDGLRPGSSGSGVFDADDRLIGIVFTANIGSGESCAVGNPCERREGEAISVPGRSYFKGLSELAGCFGDQGTCRLPRAPGLRDLLREPAPATARRLRIFNREEVFRGAEDFQRTVEQVFEAYREIAARHGKSLTLLPAWSDEDELSAAKVGGRDWAIRVPGALARFPSIQRDALALVICHELGHELGGYPFKVDVFEPADRIHGGSAEAQADYFATLACARQVWSVDARDASRRARLLALTEGAFPECDRSWSSEEERYVCRRAHRAIEGIADFFTSLGGERIDPSTPDPRVARWSILDEGSYPSLQCRIDTMVAGALCPRSFAPDVIPGLNHPRGQQSAEAEAEAGKYSCFVVDGDRRGSRPRCWYAPKRLPQ